MADETLGGLEDNEGIIRIVHPSVAQDARSIEDMLAPGLWYLLSNGNDGEFHKDIPGSEKEAFVDLLRRLLEYDPAARLQGQDLLGHRWFSG